MKEIAQMNGDCDRSGAARITVTPGIHRVSHPVVWSVGHGFEPAKSFDVWFTITPLCPLAYPPAFERKKSSAGVAPALTGLQPVTLPARPRGHGAAQQI